MKNEQDKMLQALQIAIQMEIDGKKYYQKIGNETNNQLGRELFESLSIEENFHRQKFEEIFEAIRGKKDWPEIDFQLDGGKRLRTIFAEAIRKIDSDIKTPTSELEAIKTAIDMENKTYDFYRSQGKIAVYDVERGFYDVLAAQEREHQLVLLDYYEYLKDQAGWFMAKEHSSMDGG
ncbi:MAG: ferritin family protein [Dehalococcoidales bacterium]|jgi:rubrerythrin|nr:ferritin family protein [Dehalococcoidales bacterium]